MLSLFLGALCLQAPPTQEALRDLIRQIPKVTVSRDAGISDEQEALAKQLQAHGARAIPELLRLLDAHDYVVRGFAGYTLRGIHGLGDEHLDALIAAYRGGNGWVPGAIAHVGTPRAIAFLVDDLKANPQRHTQATGGLWMLGETGAIALASAFADPAPVGDEFEACVCEVFGGLLDRALPAIDILLAAARRRELPPSNRRLAVESIGCIGIAAQRTIPELRGLSESEPGLFSEAVEKAILGIGSREAAEILARQLGGWDVCTLRGLAALHENGLEAGPEVLEDLAAADPDVRVAAARALGYIGYSAAIDALVRETIQSDDWRLAFAAVESLGRLHAHRARPALLSVAADYWYPPVRTAAREALAALQGTFAYEHATESNGIPYRFFDFADRERFHEVEVELPRLSAGPDELTEAERRRHTYSVELRGWDEQGEHVTPRTEEPGCGLRVSNGVLVGSCRGEWGGELVFLRPGAAQQTVLDDNVLSVHRTASGILAIAGLAHMDSNNGHLYRIDACPDGSYKATWWKRLPGDPLVSGFLGDGSLFIHCLGGDVVLTVEGRLRMADAR